jgi:hypothetical protein
VIPPRFEKLARIIKMSGCVFSPYGTYEEETDCTQEICETLYVCVDPSTSTCAIPDKPSQCSSRGGSLPCYSGLDECQSVCMTCQSPLGGVWKLSGGNLFPPREFTFGMETYDDDGYVWYSSSVFDTETGLDPLSTSKPVLEVGIKSEVGELVRSVSIKFRGRVVLGGEYYSLWSGTPTLFGTGSAYDTPTPYAIAEVPLTGQPCLEFESIDLSRVCGSAQCATASDGVSEFFLGSLKLERGDLCGDGMITSGSGNLANFGSLEGNECECIDNLTGQWEQSRYTFADGTRTYVSEIPDREFEFDFVDRDGYEWWVSTDKNVNGETLSELGFLTEIQGTERVTYVKMRGVSQWNENPRPELTYYPFWSTSSSGGSYDNPDAFEISRVSEDECYSTDLMQIPFQLDWAGVVKTGTMKFERTLCWPLDGAWKFYRGGNVGAVTYKSIFGDDDNQMFNLNFSGRVGDTRWYESSVVTDAGYPVVEVGIVEEVVDGSREVGVKFRGYMRTESDSYGNYTGDYRPFWSGLFSDPTHSYSNPEPHVFATYPEGDDSCFVLDSVDLSKFCGGIACYSYEKDGQNIFGGTVKLERADRCPGSHVVGGGDSANNGSLESNGCGYPLAIFN